MDSPVSDGITWPASLARWLLHDIYRRILQLNQQILACDREIENLARRREPTRRLDITWRGTVTAIALVAGIADPIQFHNGRQLAAWLGRVPRQYSTGGKTRLGRITKQDNMYLRILINHGPRAV